MIAVLVALMVAHAEPRPASPDVADAVVRPVRVSLSWATPTPVGPSEPVSPRWTRLPDVEDLMNAYPAEALRNRMGGGAGVAEETPVGLGFGEAALALAPKFEFSTSGPDGQSLVGGTFRIPLAWNAPQ